MQIRYVIPGPMSSTKLGRRELKRREALLRAWAAPDVDVQVHEAPSGPASIESAYEEYLAVPALVQALTEAERDGIDALIVGCFDDPGVDALRELSKKTLVVGPGAAAMHLASLLGSSFGIVTVPNPTATRRLVLSERLDTRLVEIALVQLPVLEIGTNPAATLEAIEAAGKDLVTKGAETIVLGCMSMAFLNADSELGQRMSVPIVNPAKVALGVAETLVRANLCPSRLTFPPPPKLTNGQPLGELLVSSH